MVQVQLIPHTKIQVLGNMQIPTITSRGSLLGSNTPAPTAGAASFGARSADATSEFVGQLARSAGQVISVHQMQKSIEADKWTNDAMTELRDSTSKWMADQANNSKETFADDFKAIAAKSLSDYEAKAPNAESKAKLREQFQRFSSSRYEAALSASAKTKIDNLILSNENSNASVLRAYQTDRNVPGLDANNELKYNIEDRFTAIDQAFGVIAPEKAKQLKGQLIEDAAYTTMNYSPETAREILSKGTEYLDGRRIHAIESQIKTAEESSRIVDRARLDKMVENRLSLAKSFKRPAKFTLNDIKPYLPDDKANDLVSKVNAQIDVFNDTADHVDKIKAWNPQAQANYAKELQAKIGNEETAGHDYGVAKLVASQVSENQERIKNDPAGYLADNNPSVKALTDHIKSLSADNEDGRNTEVIRQKMAERDTVMLRLQSRPSKEDDKNLHFVANRAQLKVVSDAEAEAMVQAINESSPEEVVQTIKEYLAQHPGNEKIAFNNLVQLRGDNGLRGEYWLLYKNVDNIAANDLAGALASPTANKELSPEKMQDFTKALDGNSGWRQFLQVFPNDNYQRQEMTAGMQRGVLAYANVLAQSGMSPELAVAKSVDTWVYSEMAAATVNGQPVLFDKQMGNRKFTEQEVQSLANNLSELPKVLSPKSIKLTDDEGRQHFPTIFGPSGPGNDTTKMEVLRQLVIDRGFFKPAGDYATLYMRNDTGTPFEVRDQENKAIAVKLSDVPEFTRYVIDEQTGLRFPFPGGAPEVKPLIEKTGRKAGLRDKESGFTGMANLVNPFSPHNIANRIYGSRGLGVWNEDPSVPSQTISTNWPVEPNYIQRIKR